MKKIIATACLLAVAAVFAAADGIRFRCQGGARFRVDSQ